MQPLLSLLDTLDVTEPGLKERLFDIVVDLSPRQFNQLCNELVGLGRFQKKYSDALITDAPHLIRPFVHFLPRVEIEVQLSDQDYDRNQFYRWLEEVSAEHLRTVVREIERLYEEASENVDCYVVNERICGEDAEHHCWKMNLQPSTPLATLFNRLKSWKKEPSA